MSELTSGTLVQHTSLGVGRVVAVEPDAVHVFFPESAKRFAAKLRWPLAKPMLRTEGLEPDSWLEGLSSFSLDPVTGRYGLTGNWLSHDQSVAEFLARTPGGFAEGSRGGRPARWRAARAAWVEQLGEGRGEALLAAGNLGDLTARVLKVERLVAAVSGVVEDDALEEALADPETARPYFEALFELLSVPSPNRARFEKLFAATQALQAPPGVAWTLATLFPFLADPVKHVLLRPKATRAAAERLGCDIRYDAAPNWATYAALRTFALRLLDRLKAIGARDQIDVETFLHALATRRSTASRAEPEGAAAPKAVRARTAKAARVTRSRPRTKARAEG